MGEVPRGEVTDEDFKQFRNIVYGYRAMFVILNTYYKKYGLKTIREWISRWAPLSDGNHTLAYIDSVCRRVQIHSDEEIDMDYERELCDIVAAMAMIENDEEPNMVEIKIGYKLFYP
ncbi:MAG: structural protein P5 [Tannerellaceae bacterium]|jgi:hypothetical protein|nr:structural protein P5 [Tannerellaceae bacterium]